MIKLQAAINKPAPEKYLSFRAKSLLSELNQKTKTGQYKQSSLIRKLDKFITKSETEAYKIEYAEGCNTTLARQKEFYAYLKKNNYKNLKKIIVARPKKIEAMIVEISKIINSDDIYSLKKDTPTQTKFGKLISGKLFNYKSYRSSDFCITLYKELNFTSSSCPYCNLNKISIISLKVKKTEKAMFDLDHFYPKSIYPYLALSFFNHIPCCGDCNSRTKHDKNFRINTHINPYLESFNDRYKFQIPNSAVVDCRIDEVFLNRSHEKPHDRTADDLELISRYKDFDDINRLVKTFSNNKHLVKEGKENELRKYIFDQCGAKKYKNDILKRNYSKIERDILKIFDVNNVLGFD